MYKYSFSYKGCSSGQVRAQYTIEKGTTFEAVLNIANIQDCIETDNHKPTFTDMLYLRRQIRMYGNKI